MQEYLNDLYNSVKTFNSIAGNSDVSAKAFLNQQKLINEEVEEIAEGIRTGDVVAILDGAIDSLYVVMGTLHKLELMGCDIQGAIKQVCVDNSTKFPSDEETAVKTVMHYNKQNVNAKWEYNKEYQRYVIKDENGKVKKPYNFIPTDLSGYVPKELQEKGLL